MLNLLTKRYKYVSPSKKVCENITIRTTTNFLRYAFAALKIDPSKDYYRILQIDEAASSADIKKQYYKLVKEFHPDLNKNNEELFKKINEAYEILGDEKNRREYATLRENTFTYSFNARKTRSSSSNQSSSYPRWNQTYQGSNNSTDNANQGYEQQQQQQYQQYYKPKDNSYYSASQAHRDYIEKLYRQELKNYQTYQNMRRGAYQQGQKIDDSEESRHERVQLAKKGLFAFGAVILSVYMIVDIVVNHAFYQGTKTYKVQDTRTGQEFYAHSSTIDQIKARGYDVSFIQPTDKDLKARYGNIKQSKHVEDDEDDDESGYL